MSFLFLLQRSLTGNEIKGVHIVREESEERLLVAGQLQNLYLSPGLRETTIGEFLRQHPEVIKRVFQTDYFLYEPSFEWLEHDGTCEDRAINPDLLVKRPDGYYDIYDLKTAALRKRNITKGRSKRRRFIDYVYEGVAQLANYAEYFKFPKNAEYAKQKYGIEIIDPKLILVVGSWENSDRLEVEQALRSHQNVTIIDYDTICHQFIGTAPGVATH